MHHIHRTVLDKATTSPLEASLVRFVTERAVPHLTRHQSNPRQAQRLLERLLQNSENPLYQIPADALLSLFWGYAKEQRATLHQLWSIYGQLTGRNVNESTGAIYHYTPREQVDILASLLHACASCTAPSAGYRLRAEKDEHEAKLEYAARHAILEHVDDIYQQHTHEINTLFINNVMHLHANDSAYDAASNAENWLLTLSRLAAEGHAHCQPNTQSFNHVLKAWAYHDGIKGAERCREILQLMMQLGATHAGVQPHEGSFRLTLIAHTRRGLVSEAEDVLRLGVEYYRTLTHPHVEAVLHTGRGRYRGRRESTGFDRRALTGTLNATLTAWLKNDGKDAATIIQRIEGLVLQYADEIPPDAVTSGIILQAHLCQSLASGVQRFAQGLTPLNEDIYAMLFRAFHYSDDERVPGWALQVLRHNFAEEICRVHPKSVVFCLEQNKDNVDVCREIYAEATRSGISSATMCHRMINILCEQGCSLEAATDYLPQFETMMAPLELGRSGIYTRVISSLAKLHTKEASQMAVNIFHRMKELEVPCNGRLYNSIIWASPFVPELPEQWYWDVYHDMEQQNADRTHVFQWDTPVFKMLLRALVKRQGSTRIRGLFVRVALLLLETLEKQSDMGQKPDNYVMNMIIHGMLDQEVSIKTVRATAAKMQDMHARGLLPDLPSPSAIERIDLEAARRTGTVNVVAEADDGSESEQIAASIDDTLRVAAESPE